MYAETGTDTETNRQTEGQTNKDIDKQRARDIGYLLLTVHQRPWPL